MSLWTNVQSAISAIGAAASVTLNGVAAGDLLVLSVYHGSAATEPTLASTLGTIYVQIGATMPVGGGGAPWLSRYAGIAPASGTERITATDGTHTFQLHLKEVNNSNGSPVLLEATVANGSSFLPEAGSLTTTFPDNYIDSAAVTDGGGSNAWTAGPSYTLDPNVASGTLAVESRTAGAGTYIGIFTTNFAANWAGVGTIWVAPPSLVPPYPDGTRLATDSQRARAVVPPQPLSVPPIAEPPRAAFPVVTPDQLTAIGSQKLRAIVPPPPPTAPTILMTDPPYVPPLPDATRVALDSQKRPPVQVPQPVWAPLKVVQSLAASLPRGGSPNHVIIRGSLASRPIVPPQPVPAPRIAESPRTAFPLVTPPQQTATDSQKRAAVQVPPLATTPVSAAPAASYPLWTEQQRVAVESQRRTAVRVPALVDPVPPVLPQSDWSHAELLRLTASGPFFTPEMVGDTIVLHGASGDTVTFTITGYLNATTVTGFPNLTVPMDLRGVTVPLWDHGVDAVSGLSALEGAAVSVFADGFVAASPNNPSMDQVTVTSGVVELDQPYVHIWVGLPYIGDLETLDIDMIQGQNVKDQKMLVTRVGLYVEASRGIFAGAALPDASDPNPLDGMDEFKLRDEADDMTAPPPVITGYRFVNIDGTWNRTGRIAVRQVDPVPLTILAAVPQGLLTPEK